jgi:predicted nucleic acid-binding protein
LERAFLHTNVLFSAAREPRSRLLSLWSLPGVEVVTSAYVVEEVHRNLESEAQRSRFEALLARTRVVAEAVSINFPAGLRLRDKDRPILAAAVSCGATHLVTGDWRDFGPYFGRRIAGVLILPPSDYMRAHRP